MKRLREVPELGWVFLAIIVVGVVLYFAGSWRAEAIDRETAVKDYEAKIETCQQRNPERRAVTLAISTAARNATAGAAAYEAALDGMLSQPYIRADGSKMCARSYERP